MKCFFNNTIKIAIARAGNVIGGDWSRDRLVPDCIKFTLKKKKVIIKILIPQDRGSMF